ncbi:MAG: flagellar biosynthesis protein FlgN [Treponema sp.]|nr:flagellar biosynthesis protein FlgN [Treponema sp.]
MESNLTQQELDERVAILRKYKDLLRQQRDKFQAYLRVLESQEKSIHKEDGESVEAHTMFAERLIGSIKELQKAIIPMQGLYDTSPAADDDADGNSVEKLKRDLNDLRNRAISQNDKNRALLRTQIEQITDQLSKFKNPYSSVHSIYADQDGAGSMIQIEI